MIILDNISKSFDGVYAVRNVSASVKDGEVFGLVGPNGAGKTTTIRMMTGLLKPDKGTIRIGDHDIIDKPLQAKSILGYVPDKAFLYDKLTLREFLNFIASIHGLGKNRATERMNTLLNLFGLADLESELIESLSQGMRQRLLFTSSLIHEPEVLLIDEPFMGLDPFGVRMLKGLIKDLSARGMSIFLATHSLHIAEELCDRVGFIHKGCLTAIKSREEIQSFEGGLEGFFLRMGH